MKRRILAAIIAVAAGAVRAGDPGFSFDASINRAGASAVSGFVQTPAGGKPGTSSERRPTLDELGVGGVTFFDLSLGYCDGANGYYVGGQFIRTSGLGSLDSMLTTHGETFQAGSAFNEKLNFDWYRVGYERWFSLFDGRFTWAPKVELALLNFDYKFSTGARSTSRGYSKPAPRIGVDGELAVTEKTALLGSAAGSVPVGSTPQIFTTDLTLMRILYGHEGGRFGALFVGAGMLYIDYKDSQPMANHVRFEAAPYFTAGFMVQM